MVVNHVFRASTCSNCRPVLLRAFTRVDAAPTKSLHKPVKSLAGARFQQPARLFSQFQQHKQLESSDEKDVGLDGAQKVAGEDHTELAEEGNQKEENEPEALPWYLQQQQASYTAPQVLSDRQKLPELPEHSPEILKPLLEQISIDLGLDDLSLLDLRNLDPPPALGANLLMVIGTARSEKHLHVSADRLCRWLRSEYKLRPDADGLLGRAELKLKLKRKAKRAKLVGNGMGDDADDGVRTGWVCVNVGSVKDGSGKAKAVTEELPFGGFGSQSNSVKIVVQMLTQEKREELDLEHLWGGILRRAGNEAIEGAPTTEGSGSEESIGSSSGDASLAPGFSRSSPFGQSIRAYHTTCRTQSQLQRHNKSKARSPAYAKRAPLGVTTYSDSATVSKTALANAPPPTSTFLQFQELRLSGEYIDTLTYMSYLHNILAAASGRQSPNGPELLEACVILEEMFNRGENVLTEEMFFVLYQLLPPADSPLEFTGQYMYYLPVRHPHPIQARLEALVSSSVVQIRSTASQIYLLELYASRYNWPAFFEYFRAVVRGGRARGPELYECLFRSIALSQHQRAAMGVLRQWFPAMGAEDPAIVLEEFEAASPLKLALRRCIVVADPQVCANIEESVEMDSEWVRMYQKCS
jgi:hypothetical protein